MNSGTLVLCRYHDGHFSHKHGPIVVHCKSGARSAKATQLLKDAEFRHVKNLEGGILRWAKDIDPALPTY